MSGIEEIEFSSKPFNEPNAATESTEDIDEIEPTAEELTRLKHVSDQIPLAAWLIIVCEFCERFSFIGLTGPFQNYIEFPIPISKGKQSGVLGRGHRTATLLTTLFQFFCYLTPIFGAILADQFWGKYKTIFFGCVAYMIGLLVLVLSSIPPSINAGLAFPGLIVAMLIISFGTGGVKSNVSPLMAEQYTRTKPIVKEIRGEKKIVDPTVTVQSMFNWFYWSINLGGLSAIITTNIEKYHSFWLAYFLPMIIFTGSIAVLTFARHRYIRKAPTGSLIIRASRVITRAIQMRRKLSKEVKYQHFLDYAKENPLSSTHDDTESVIESNNRQFIEDLKQALRACRVFAFYPFYWICYNQLGGNMVSQAAQMNVGPLPNDLLQNIDPIALLIFIPIFDKLVYPTLRRLNIKFGSISRITCGFFCISIAMAWTTLVQHLIYVSAPNFNYTTKPCPTCQTFNNITVAWQIPSYVFIAISEIFASIAGIEYAFTHAPSSMKSVVMSFFLFTSAIGSALSFALLPITVDPDLMWMYASLSIVSFFVGIIFFLLFRTE